MNVKHKVSQKQTLIKLWGRIKSGVGGVQYSVPHKAQLLLSFNLSGFSFLSDEWKHILDLGLDLVLAMCSGYNVNGFVHR